LPVTAPLSGSSGPSLPPRPLAITEGKSERRRRRSRKICVRALAGDDHASHRRRGPMV
jgi:hypothetical protein